MTAARVPGVILTLLALGALVAGCGGGSSSAASTPVAFSTAGWPALAGDVDLAALRSGFPPVGHCVLRVDKKTPKTLALRGCGAGRSGALTAGRTLQRPACSKHTGLVRCFASNGVSIVVRAPRPAAAIALLKATIEAVDETLPEDAVRWGMWLEPGLGENKGSLTLAAPRRADEAIIMPCAAGAGSAAMLGTLTVSKRTARHVAGRGVHIKMIEKPAAVRSFSMAINGECRKGGAGVLRGAAIEPPASRVQPFVLVIPRYYGPGHRNGARVLLRGLLLEPKLYRGEDHNPLPGTMLARPEDREAAPGQIPLLSSAWTEG